MLQLSGRVESTPFESLLTSIRSHIPGYRIYFHPHALFSAVLPRLSSYFNIGEQYTWRYKHDLFQRFNSDLISVVSYSPQTRSIITCDPEAIKFIVAERKKFMKPLGMYAPLAMFGQNVGVSEGAEWVRHKKIVASSNLLEVSCRCPSSQRQAHPPLEHQSIGLGEYHEDHGAML